MNEVKSESILKEILSFSVYLLFVLVFAYLIVRFVGQRTEVIGESMRETLQDGDNLIVDKITYRFGDPERFDIVVFPYRYEKDTLYVKRIIGLPGETVQITEDGEIYINGERLYEFYGREVMLNPGRAITPILLSDDEYFVLGDNRNYSSDSRYDDVGSIKRKDIVGKAFVRIWPLNSIGKIND